MDNPEVGAVHLAKGVEYLGRGVNIFSQGYLVPPSLGRVIDLTDDNVTMIPLDRTEVKETYGSSFAEFIQTFSVAAGMEGSYRGFSGSVESKFATSSRDVIDIKFAQLSLISSGAIVSLSRDRAVLKRYFNPDFAKALETAKPEELFSAYGTHVAVGLDIGGMISYYAYSKETVHQSERDFKLAAKFKYEGYGAGVGANAELTEAQKKLAETVEGNTHLFVNGGEEVARMKVQGGDKGSYVAWAATLSTRPGFVGFQQHGLLAVWELADGARRNALKLAYRQEAARQSPIRIFTHTGEKAAHPTARVTIPKEYKLLAGGARDNFEGEGNLLTASFPDGDRTWVARGKDHVTHDQATISVFAIGIYDNKPEHDNEFEPLWEVAQFSATGGQAPHPSAEVSIAGDFIAKGGVLVGGGAVVKNGPGADKLLTSSYPKSATTWAGNAADPVNSDQAAITVFAQGLCCLVDGVKIKVDTNQVQSIRKDHPSEKCSPDNGFALAGGGAFVDFEPGLGNLLISSYPENDHTWAARSKDHRNSSPATITAYAIGLKIS
jgi:hypothetical protein